MQRASRYVAVALELGMLATFAAERSFIGLLLWSLYLWFSATWAVGMQHFKDEGPPP